MIKFNLNYNVMGLRSRESRKFEWYSATLSILSLHIHDKEGEGLWRWKVTGIYTKESKRTFDSFQDARSSLFRFLTKELSGMLDMLNDAQGKENEGKR